MWLQAPASSQHLRARGWAGGRIHAGAVAVPVIERPGMGTGLEMWRDAAKCIIALASPALRCVLGFATPFLQHVALAGTV